MVARVRGMEGDGEQALLASARDTAANVEERSAQPAVDEVADPPDLLDRLARTRRALVDLHLDDLEVLLPKLQQVHELVLWHLVLDESEDARRRTHRRRDAEQVEVRLVARVVHAGDHLGDSVLLLRN